MSKSTPLWLQWFRNQSQLDRNIMAANAIGRLIECEELKFRQDDYVDENGRTLEDEEILIENLYCPHSGENLIDWTWIQ